MQLHRNSILAVLLVSYPWLAACKINREQVVRRFNPYRNASSLVTPMQVGNGDFAFGADITGLQAILPYNILSSWGWHNNSLPATPGQTAPSDFTGVDWWTHGRLVNYDQPNSSEADISQWMISNPNRINLGRIGLLYNGQVFTEDDLMDKSQYTDLYAGGIYSQFVIGESLVSVETFVHPQIDTVGISVQSTLISTGELQVFFDYPYATNVDKFEDPFVGVLNATSNHTTTLKQMSKNSARVKHVLDATTYYNNIAWEGNGSLSGPLADTHRYVLQATNENNIFDFTATYSPGPNPQSLNFQTVKDASMSWWQKFWENGAFVDLTATSDTNALELQRRIILSEYYCAVNAAGQYPPQESGLANNGWYGKCESNPLHNKIFQICADKG